MDAKILNSAMFLKRVELAFDVAQVQIPFDVENMILYVLVFYVDTLCPFFSLLFMFWNKKT